jgi:hypothetical protein
VRETESALQESAEYVLQHRLARQPAAPYIVRWVRQFLAREATAAPLADQVRRFCEDLERTGRYGVWQIRQAEHALRLYFANVLARTDWLRQPPSAVVDEHAAADPIGAIEQLRPRIRTRHYSYRAETSYIDWTRRFLNYLAERQGAPRPRVDAEGARNVLTHLAVHRRVSASTQNQAMAAVVFLCREVLCADVDGVPAMVRAKGSSRPPHALACLSADFATRPARSRRAAPRTR